MAAGLTGTLLVAQVVLHLAKVVDFDCCHPDGVPFKDGEVVLILGDIQQMQGHVAVAKRDGGVHWGWDATYFERLSEDEA